MAEEITQFQDSQPLLKEGSVVSKATGFEKMGEVLGVAAKELFAKSESMAQEASSTNYLQSQAMLANLTDSAKMQIYENPSLGSSIAVKANENAEIIKSNAFLNSSDRQKFNFMADDAMRHLAFEGKKSVLSVANEQARYETLSNFQKNLEVYTNSMYSNDPKGAIDQQNAMLESIRGQLASGIITAHEAVHLQSLMDESIKRHDFMVKHLQNGDATAADYHATKAFSSDSTIDNAHLPTNENTRQRYDLNTEYSSIGDIQSAYAQGKTVNPIVYKNIKNRQTIIKLSNYKTGASDAEGMIHSGSSFRNIEEKIKELNAISKRDTFQNGQLDRLSNYVSDIKNGEGLKYVSTVQSGAQAHETYRTQVDAINSSKNSDSDKQMMLIDAHNEFISSLIHTYESTEIPQQYRTLFDKNYVNSIKNTIFSPDGKVEQGIRTIWDTKKDALPYLANQMEEPNKAMTVMVIGLLKGKADTNFISNLAITQKDGIEYKHSLIQHNMEGFNNAKTDDRMALDLKNSSELHGLFELNKYSPIVKGENVTSSIVDMGIKYIKGRALMERDTKIEGYKKYLDEFTSNISRAYDPLISNNFSIDKNVIPLHNDQVQMVAEDALRDVYEKKYKEGYTRAQMEEQYINDPYRVVSTPTGHLVVVDIFGKVVLDKSNRPYYDHLYVSTTLSSAQHHAGKPFFRDIRKPILSRGEFSSD